MELQLSIKRWLRQSAESMLLFIMARRAPRVRQIHFRRMGLRSIREQWWWQTQLETPAMLWRQIWQLEQTPEPRIGEGRAGEPASIVVYMPGHIGDLLLTVPMMQALRSRFPLAHIEWIVGPWVAGLARRYDVADTLTEFSPVWYHYRRGADGPGCREQVKWAMEHKPVDVLISTSNTDLSTLFVGRACRPAWWIGRSLGTEIYPVAERQTVVNPERYLYEADDLLRLLHPLGIFSSSVSVSYTVTASERELSRQMLEAMDGGVLARHYAVIAPSAGWPGKQWPMDRWAVVADELIRRGLTVLLVGAPSDAGLVEELMGTMNEKAINLVGRTSLVQLAALIEGAAIWIGSDSGGMHLAVAVGTPTVSLFGPTHPAKWAAPGPRNLVLWADHDCSGCVAWHPRASCLQNGACMKKINQADVETAALLQLADVR